MAVWLKPYLPDHSLRHYFVTAIKHYQKVIFYQLKFCVLKFRNTIVMYIAKIYIFADIAFEVLNI